MSIAERFSGFSRDFNTPVKGFTSMREAGMFNLADTGLGDLLGEAQGLAGQLRDNASSLLGGATSALNGIEGMVAKATAQAAAMASEAKSAGAQAMDSAFKALGADGISDSLQSVTRMARAEFDNVVNLAGASESLISGIVSDVFDGFPTPIKTAINSAGAACRRRALSDGLGLGNNFRRNKNCSNLSVGGTACPPGVAKGLLGTLGNDVASALNRGMKALKKAVQGLASLLSMGYSANLCNVISSVLDATGIGDKSVISYAAAAILNKEGLRGSVKAVMDMGKANLGNLGALAPLAVANTAKNLVSSIGINSENIKQNSEAILTSFDEVDPKWRLTDDGEASTAKLGLKNPTTAKLLDYQLRTSTFDINDLNAVNVSTDRTFAASYALV